jgi:hypothetical protein
MDEYYFEEKPFAFSLKELGLLTQILHLCPQPILPCSFLISPEQTLNLVFPKFSVNFFPLDFLGGFSKFQSPFFKPFFSQIGNLSVQSEELCAVLSRFFVQIFNNSTPTFKFFRIAIQVFFLLSY